MTSVTEMVDRVAKAIWIASVGLQTKDKQREIAIAAIEGMREPTEEMLDAVAGSDLSPETAWKIMIAKALGVDP